MCADRVLEAKENQLDLVDGRGVEVQVQLQFGDGGRHNAPLRGMDEVSKDADDLLNVFDGQLELFAALYTHLYTQRNQKYLCSAIMWCTAALHQGCN